MALQGAAVTARDVWEAMLADPFAFALIDPSTHLYVDANQEYATLLGRSISEVKGLDHLSLYVDPELAGFVGSLFAAILSGNVQVLRGGGSLRGADGEIIELKGWARRFEWSPTRRLVVASIVEADSDSEADDIAWVVRAPHVFGLPLDWSRQTSESDEGRAGELEGHLRRIGLEVRSAGLLQVGGQDPRPSIVRTFDELSPRQREIVSRLLAGERVTEIARALYLSPSTVRNHLTVVFRKFGVHSQIELLSVLRDSPSPRP